MEKVVINSPLGFVLIEGNEDGISKISVTSEETILSETIPALFREVVTQLNEYFEGNRTEFTVPLDFVGSDFQKSVWEVLTKIPYGQTWSYAKQAEILGDKNKVRAVANANGMNKISILIPCHRVIGSDGNLTGYGGGIWRKQKLLELEKAILF